MALSLATILTFTSASSLYIFHRRLVSVAEFAALASASRGVSAGGFIRYSDATFTPPLWVIRDEIVDGATREVEVCGVWHSPIPIFVSEAQICAQGLARSG
ncbi:MAG: hypothetical protein ACKOUD_05240 [Rhodoluna sp.]